MCYREILLGMGILITAGSDNLLIDGESIGDGPIAGEPGLQEVS